MSKVAVIIAAGGKGERFGGAEKKTFAKLDGREVFLRALELFVNRDDVCAAILVVPSEDLDMVKEKFGPNLGFMGVKLVEGGQDRCASVAAGLAVVPDDADLVAVHDAVRPCTTTEMIDAVFAEAAKTGAAILATPLHGTLKRVSESGTSEPGTIDATVSRENLYEAQTPQVFKQSVIREAFANKPDDSPQITDDAQLVELSGHPVSIVKCDPTNLKITTKSDLTLAKAVLKSRPAKVAPKFGAFDEAQW